MLPQLLPQSPLECALWAGLAIGGWLLGYFGSTFEGKWRRRFNDERRFYAQYRDETDRLNIEKTRRITELEAQKNALSQEVVRLRGDAMAAPAPVAPPAPEPVVAPAAPEMPPENPVEPAPEPAPEIAAAQAPDPATDAPEPASDTASEPVAEVAPPTADPAAEPTTEPAAALPLMAAAALPEAAAAIAHPNILPHIETQPVGEVLPPAPPVIDAHRDEPLADAQPARPAAPPEPVAPPFIEPETVAEAEPAAAATEIAHTTQAADDETPEPVQIDAALNGLTRIRGIDATLAAGLGSLGVRQIEDIERLSAEDEKAIEIQLNLPPGQIANQQWRLQAALIGSGEDGLIGG